MTIIGMLHSAYLFYMTKDQLQPGKFFQTRKAAFILVLISILGKIIV